MAEVALAARHGRVNSEQALGKLRADFRKRTECALGDHADKRLTEVIAQGSLRSVHVSECAADAIVTSRLVS